MPTNGAPHAQIMMTFIKEWGPKLGVEIVCSKVCTKAPLLALLLPLRSGRQQHPGPCLPYPSVQRST